MIQGVDTPQILHRLSDLDTLNKQGIANTVKVTNEYIFTADNELNYLSSIYTGNTVTISELPTNTVSIKANIRMNRTASGIANIQIKRNTSDTEYTMHGAGVASSSFYKEFNGIIEIFTDQNTFYVLGLFSACVNFKIFSYKVSA